MTEQNEQNFDGVVGSVTVSSWIMFVIMGLRVYGHSRHSLANPITSSSTKMFNQLKQNLHR